jgi:hypothetical protein
LKTLVDEQADPTKGQSQLYNLEYYSDGSLLLLSSYQTASAEEPGIHFADSTFKGGTATKVGLSALTNAFMAKIDANGDLIWAVPDTTYHFDLGGSVSMATTDGGAIFAQKMRNKKGRFVTFVNVYDHTSYVTASNNITASYERTAAMTADPNDSYAWAGLAQDEDKNVYLAGYQADTLYPTWHDTIAMRPNKWNGNAQQKSSNCNTVILKYNAQMDYVAYTTTGNDELVYDRPVGLHYEGGKLYVAGTYKNATESGIYYARYDQDLNREAVVYHPITGSLQFQQTKFDDGKIFVCGGLGKNGTITIGEKTITSSTTAANSGFVYVMSMEDGSVLDAAVRVPENNALNITVAAFTTDSGYVAYNHETLNGIQMALHYDSTMNLVSVDTLGQGGGSSTISCVGRSADGKHVALGLRARTTADYTVLGETYNFADKTNWYSVIATLNEKEGETTGIEETPSNSPSRGEKILRNGQLYIKYNGTMYDVQGRKVEN